METWDHYDSYADQKPRKQNKKKKVDKNKKFEDEDKKKRFDKKNAERAPWKNDPY